MFNTTVLAKGGDILPETGLMIFSFSSAALGHLPILKRIWNCYHTCSKMAAHCHSVPGQNSYSKNPQCCCLHHTAGRVVLSYTIPRSPFSQKTEFTTEKVQFHSDPAKAHSKWRQGKCWIEVTVKYTIPLELPCSSHPSYFHPWSRKTHAAGKQRNSSSWAAGREQAWERICKVTKIHHLFPAGVSENNFQRFDRAWKKQTSHQDNVGMRNYRSSNLEISQY